MCSKDDNKCDDSKISVVDWLYGIFTLCECAYGVYVLASMLIQGENSWVYKTSSNIPTSNLILENQQALMPWLVAMLVIMVLFLLNLILSIVLGSYRGKKEDSNNTTDSEEV